MHPATANFLRHLVGRCGLVLLALFTLASVPSPVTASTWTLAGSGFYDVVGNWNVAPTPTT